MNRWLAEPEPPVWQEVSTLAGPVEESADAQLFAFWDEFAGTYDEQEPDAQRSWLSDLAAAALAQVDEALSS